MAKRSGDNGKENASFSIKSVTIETLDSFCALMEVDNRSAFVDAAIREKIGREITSNPLAFKKISSLLGDLAN